MVNMLVGLRDWVDARLPIMRAWNTHMAKYYAPKNFNFWYFFGVLSLLVLVNQLLTGIWLTMSYNPSQEGAFASVEYIMRDVDFGWILRYLHSTGASAFFVVVYLHMFSRTSLRVVQETAGADLDLWHADLYCPDGGGRSWGMCCPGAKCPIGAPR